MPWGGVCVCGGGGISVYDKGGRTVSVHSSSPGPSFQGRQGGKFLPNEALHSL